MSDLISRAEAMDASEKFIKDCNPDHFVGHQKFIEYMDNAEIGSFGKWQFANGFNMGLTAAEVAIKKLPSVQHWIPVAERLPEEIDDYLVTVKDRYGDTYVMIKCFFPDEELWWDVPNNGIVTAWMKLPEPYEVEE